MVEADARVGIAVAGVGEVHFKRQDVFRFNAEVGTKLGHKALH